MSLSSEAQALFDHARQSLPRWLTGAANAALEWLYGFTEVFDEIRVQGQDWIDITYLENATGAELDQHAKDRGTTRRAGESDGALRERIRQITDAVTEPALLVGIDAILDTNGVYALMNVKTHVTTGWTTVFSAYDSIGAGGYQTALTLRMVNDGTNPPTLEASGPDTIIHYQAGVTTRSAIETLVTSSSGLFYVSTASASGASVLQAGDAFGPKNFVLGAIVALRRDRGHYHTNGSCRAFLNRGYRMTTEGRPMAYIVILPFGIVAAVATSVAEYLRQYGPGGYQYYVERRLNP